MQLAFVATLGLSTFLAAPANAGNTWTGGGTTTNWSDNGNWGGAPPTYGTLTFTTGGTQGTTSVNNSITSMNTLFWTGTSAWTINASATPTTLSLFDNGGAQAKIENQSTGLVTINSPITFAANNATPANPFGEINAVNGDITFGSAGTLTVNGTSVNGIKMFGSNRTTTFNNTVSASGKYFATTGTNTTVAIGGAVTTGNFFLMNGGTLKLNTGGSLTTSGGSAEALRLGGDFGTTGSQDLTKGATFQLTPTAGGLTTSALINTVANNTSGALLIDSLNTSNTNTLNGDFYLDSNLRVNQASGGTIVISDATTDIKGQTLTLTGTGGLVNLTGVVGNSVGSGQIVVGVDGTVGGPTVTMSQANTYSGQTFVRAGTLAFTSTGSAANSTIRLGSTTGTAVDAAINLSTSTGATTISSVINAVTTSGSGALSINSNNSSNTNILSGQIALDRDLAINQASGGTLNITSVHTAGGDPTNILGTDVKGNTLTLGGSGTIAYSGTIYNSSGTGKLIKTGSGTTTLSGVNTYAGTTNVTGGTLSVGGAVGSTISGSSSVTLTGGTAVVLDYTTAGDDATNKIGNAATVTITSVGSPNASGSSGLQLLGNATLDTNETIGTLALGGGAAVIGVTQATASRVTKLTATSGLTRANFGTGLIRGSSLGAQATQVGQVILGSLTGLVQVGTSTSSTGSAGTTKDLTIVPYLIGDTSAAGLGSATSGSFLTYDTFGRGFRVLGSNEQNALTLTTDIFANTNVRYDTVATLTLDSTNRTWNSLQFARNNVGSRSLQGGGGTLAITSGALQTGDQTTADTISLGGFSKITFGNNVTGANAANEAVIFTNGGSGGAGAASTLSISSSIDVTQSGGLTKAGPGILILGGANLYTGQTTINQGTLNVGGGTAAGDLGSSSGVVLNGGNLTFNRTNTLSYTNAISGSGATGGGSVTQAGTGALTLGAISQVQNITHNASTGFLTTGNLSNIGTLTLSSSAGATIGTVSTATAITQSAAAGLLTTGNLSNIGTLTVSGTGGANIGTVSTATTITQSVGAGLLTTGNLSNIGTLTLSAAAGANIGNVTTATTIIHSAGAGTLNLGTITGITTLTDNSTTGSTTPTNIAQSGTGLTIGTINGASGSVVNFAGDGTGSTTIANLLNTAGQTVKVSAGTVSLGSSRNTADNLIVAGGTLTTTGTNRLSMANNDSQTLTISGGTLNVLITADFGERLGGDNGAGSTGNGFTGTQTGGTFNALGVNGFTLGSTSASKVASYSLSGGTLNIGNSANARDLILGADTGGTSTTTFNLSGGKLLVSGAISGSQTTGAKQSFVFTGGTLAAGTYTATSLTSTLGTAVSGSTNTLTNAGGILAPGDIGTGGKTTVTGNYSVTGANASLAIDLGGTTQATAFQTGQYDLLAVSGTAALGGKLNVSLINAFTPTNANNFTVLTTAAAGVSGTFTNTNVSKTANPFTILSGAGLTGMTVTYGTANVVLSNYTVTTNTYSGTASSAWDAASAANWTVFDPGSTTGGTVASGALAVFGNDTNATSGPIAVSLSASRDIMGLNFSSSVAGNNYTISTPGGGSIIFDNTGNAASATIADTSASGNANSINVPITLASNLAVSVTNATNNLTLGGAISGSGKTLTKTGAGTLTLSGANTYNGATSITGGKLVVSGSGTLVNSDVSVTGSGVILASGSANTVGKTLVVGNGAILAAGDASAAGTATVTNATTFNNGSLFSWDISSTGTSYDKLVSGGGLVDGDAVGGSEFRVVLADTTFANAFWNTTQTWTNIFTTDGSTAIGSWANIFTSVTVVNSAFSTFDPSAKGSFTASGNTLTWTAIPEPTSALAGLLIGAGLLRRRRNTSSVRS